jgi:4-hydroxy-tetrahydrodipicolinate reductase
VSLPHRVVVIGAGGRMGGALLRCLPEFPELALHAAIARRPIEGVAVTPDLPAALHGAAVAIDFSSAESSSANVRACREARVPVLVGTTGLGPAALAEIDAASRDIPLILAPNTSLALNVLLGLVRQAAAALPAHYDIEIVEAHHRHKADAPSGTALALGSEAAAGRRETLPASVALTGSLPGPRPGGGIGFAVLRGGDVVGEHEVRLLGPGEQLRLGHVATDRHIFARGALTGARWLAVQPPGRYRMAHVLGLNSL